MIIRRPYAFFIKNFKKIHIALLILGLVVLFHQSRVYGFVKEFLDLQTYDSANFPITKYIPAYLLILVLLLFIGCLIITIVLKRKSKPWKLYLIPTVTYFLMLFMYIIIRGYFKTYTGAETTAEMSLYRDILLFTSIAQYPSFIIFLVRIFGLDLRKFNFKSDAEYLELEDEDQEEIEISINVDKESFRRGFNRLIRNLKYIYQEHRKTCLAIFAIIVVLLLRQGYLLIASNKSYKQNQEYNVNGYTFVVNNAYYTDKKFNGEVISKKNAFVIIDLSVRNNAVIRELNTEEFHLLNGVSNYNDTGQTYGAEFEDIGKAYDKKEIEQGKTINIILIFRVDNKLDKDRFVLMYQEAEGKLKLRKIKLKMSDLSSIKDNSNMELGDSMKVTLGTLKETISVDRYYSKSEITYKYRECTTDECENKVGEFVAPQGKEVMIIEYGTEEIDSKDIIDFSTNYGKIIYIDNKGKKVVVPMKNALERVNKGKIFYTLVPSEIEDADKILLEYTIRNNKYVYGG